MLEQAKKLAARKYKEIILVGIHLGSYGRDLIPSITLASLVKLLSSIEGLERIRLGSIEPSDMSEELMAEYSHNQKLCKQAHIPLQSGSANVLKRMNRHYSPADYLHTVEMLRSRVPTVAITTDVLVGFPGETADEFRDSRHFLAQVRFAHLHVFAYSKRTGTPAANFEEQIDEEIKRSRALAITVLGEEMALAHRLKYVGEVVSVLVEAKTDGHIYSGYNSQYIKVSFAGHSGMVGKLVDVRITTANRDGVFGEIVQDLSY